MTTAELQEQLDGLTDQQKQAEINFHQITGAVAVTQQLLEKATKAEATNSSDEKKSKK